MSSSWKGTACRVKEFHDSRESLRVACLRFSTNVDYSYVYANRTCSAELFASPFIRSLILRRRFSLNKIRKHYFYQCEVVVFKSIHIEL